MIHTQDPLSQVKYKADVLCSQNAPNIKYCKNKNEMCVLNLIYSSLKIEWLDSRCRTALF